jgi:hypothetical protein
MSEDSKKSATGLDGEKTAPVKKPRGRKPWKIKSGSEPMSMILNKSDKYLDSAP